MYNLIKLPKEELNTVIVNTAAKKRNEYCNRGKRSLGVSSMTKDLKSERFLESFASSSKSPL